MSFKLKETYEPNSFYHIYNRGNRKEKIFLQAEDYHKFISLMEIILITNNYEINIQSYCLMPNHFHILLNSGSNPSEITSFMHRFMTSYAMYFNRTHKLVGRVFQSTYKAKRIKSADHYNKIVDYISENPVKAGLVQNAIDYKWSEYHRF